MRLPMEKLTQILILFALTSIIACGPPKSDEFLNQEPTAIAPADFITSTGATVSLDGSGSFDVDDSIVSYLWVQSSGTPSVTLSNANTAIASFVAPDITGSIILSFRLTVTDSFGKTDSDSVVVTVVVNQPPQAVVPADISANEFASVILDGSASSDDIGIVSYAWVQTSGLTVSIIDSTVATASFTAPEVAAGQTAVLTFDLTVTDAVGETSTASLAITVSDVVGLVGLSGTLTFDKVPHNTATSGLDYNNTFQTPIRGATVELLDASSTLIESKTSAPNGDYLFGVPESFSYIIRVKAELKSQAWDFTVVDNTSGQALYAMDSTIINVTTTSQVVNLNAPSGWNGASYIIGGRVAAPFAILDSVYQAKEKIISVDGGVSMPALKLNWSVDNNLVGGDTSVGNISTSHYNGTEIFILGDKDSDTDEYDGHVIIHEWGHYFEDKLSRSDSIGGAHGLGDKLDMRVALSEGFGNALSGIVTDDPFYRDSSGPSQSNGFDINVEANPASNQGWYSEESVQSLLYDLYDSTDDGSDNISLGFAPIYNALIGEQKNTLALTSIFSLANKIKAKAGIDGATFDALFAAQSISIGNDFGAGETNNGGHAENLPIYKAIDVDGGSVQICSFNDNGDYNKLGNRQFLRFNINITGDYRFAAIGQNADADPDLIVYQSGGSVIFSDNFGDEFVTQTLQTGSYVIEVYEFSNLFFSSTITNSCIDVTITAL